MSIYIQPSAAIHVAAKEHPNFRDSIVLLMFNLEQRYTWQPTNTHTFPRSEGVASADLGVERLYIYIYIYYIILYMYIYCIDITCV